MNDLLLMSTTSRVGMGSANGRTNSRCFSVSCSTANSGIKVMPWPLSTMRIKVSMLPR